MIRKITTLALCAIIILSTLGGCSDKSDSDSATTGSTTVATTASPNDTGTSPSGGHTNETDPEEEEKKAQIKEIYTPSAEDAAILAEEKTQSPIIYSGFDCKYFSTPALSEDLPLVSVTPLYSHAALHKYIEENSHLFDLGEDENSFSAVAERYMDSFFVDKGVLVVSFTDAAGGDNYQLTGAWEEHLHVEELHLEQLVLALKKTAGDITAGHLIVEMDAEFIGLWDSISMDIYE